MKPYLIILSGAIVALTACSEPEQTTTTNDTSRRVAPAAPVAADPSLPATAPSTSPANDGTRTQGDQGKFTSTGGTAGTTGTAPADPMGTRTQDDHQKLSSPGGSDPAPVTAPLAAGNPPVLRGEQNAARTTAAGTTAAPAATPAPMANDAVAAANSAAVAPGTPPASTEAPLLPNRDAAAKLDAQQHATDDSGRNKREDGSLPTPLDQGDSESDRTITQAIRKTVVARDDLSVNAKNVKIITREGIVTLRGPVADTRERDSIGAAAIAQQGVKRVDNLLEPVQQ